MTQPTALCIRTVRIAMLTMAVAFAGSMSFAAAAVAKNIKLTGVIKSLAGKKGIQHVESCERHAASLALFKGKKRVGTFSFHRCSAPGTEVSYSGTGSLSVGKITGKVQVGLNFSVVPPNFTPAKFGEGHVVKNSVTSTTQEDFRIPGPDLPNTIGARVTVVLTPKLVPNS